jgi:hypothetical protein
MIDAKLLASIQERAQMMITFIEGNGVPNDYGTAALTWIEDVIEMRRDVWNAEQKEGFAQNAGAYLGECLLRAHGGEWATTQVGLAVVLNDGKDVLLPFSRVTKYMQRGKDESIAFFFSVVAQKIKENQISDQDKTP